MVRIPGPAIALLLLVAFLVGITVSMRFPFFLDDLKWAVYTNRKRLIFALLVVAALSAIGMIWFRR